MTLCFSYHAKEAVYTKRNEAFFIGFYANDCKACLAHVCFAFKDKKGINSYL